MNYRYNDLKRIISELKNSSVTIMLFNSDLDKIKKDFTESKGYRISQLKKETNLYLISQYDLFVKNRIDQVETAIYQN